MRFISWPHLAAVIRSCCVYLPGGVPVCEDSVGAVTNAQVFVRSSSGFSAMFATSLTGMFPLRGADSWFDKFSWLVFLGIYLLGQRFSYPHN